MEIPFLKQVIFKVVFKVVFKQDRLYSWHSSSVRPSNDPNIGCLGLSTFFPDINEGKYCQLLFFSPGLTFSSVAPAILLLPRTSSEPENMSSQMKIKCIRILMAAARAELDLSF